MGFRKPQLILREAPGAYDYSTGKWAPGARSHFNVTASVQPMSASDLKTLPEGRRSVGMVKLYTSVELQAVREERTEGDPILQPDRLVWRGNAYELSHKDPYQSDVINHFRYFFKLLGPVVSGDVGSIWDNGGSVWDDGKSHWDR